MPEIKSISRSISSSRARWATSLLFTVDGAGFGVWAAHIPVFKQDLHLTSSSLSGVLFALVLGSIFAMPLAGVVIHRYGSRFVIWAAAPTYVLAIAALGFVPNLLFLLIAVGLFGAAKGALDVSINAQGVWVEQQLHRKIVSSFQGFWSIGGLFAASLSGYALNHGFGIHQDFGIAAGCLSVCVCLSLPFLLKEEQITHTKVGWQPPDSALLRFAGIAFLGLFAEGAMADWDGVYLRSIVGVTLAQAAGGYAAFSLAMAAGRFAGDTIIARFKTAAILRACGFLLCGGVSFALLLNIPWAAFLGFICAGFGISIIIPVVWGTAGRNQVIGPGPALATVTTIGYFGFLAGPPLIGVISTALNVREALGVVALFGLLIAGLAGFATRETAASASMTGD